jgi:hypothetical protein
MNCCNHLCLYVEKAQVEEIVDEKNSGTEDEEEIPELQPATTAEEEGSNYFASIPC